MFSSTEFFRFFENGQKQSCVTSFTMQEHFSQIGNEPGGGGYFRNFWVGMGAGTLEPLTYTRASSAEFYYPILE